MNVKIAYISFEEDWDYYTQVEIESPEHTLRFSDGEPEDNSLNRNFSDVYNIEALIWEAHEAGLRGETLLIDTVNIGTKEQAEELGYW